MAATSPPESGRLLRAAAFVLLVYGALEVLDCLALILMAAHVIRSPYPLIGVELTRRMLSHPLLMLPVFATFAGLRLAAGAALRRELLWGWWIALGVTVLTMLYAPLFFPLAGIELLGNAAILVLLAAGRFGARRALD